MPEPESKPNKYRARQAASGTARERMLNEGEGAAGKQATAGKRRGLSSQGKFRFKANRSLKIERDEAPDPDVQHVSG